MRYLLYLTLTMMSLLSMGQTSSIVLYTEEGEKFTLYVNGMKINESPAIRVKAGDISGDFAQTRVIFETPGAPELRKGMMLESGKEMTAVIRKNKKGKYVFRPVSSASTADNESPSETVRITQSPPIQTRQTTEATITTTSTSSDDGSLLDVKVGEDGSFSMKVNTDGMSLGTSNESTTVTTTQSVQTVQSTGAQQLSAQVDGNKILLSDGRVFSFKYVNSNRIGPVVEMKQPTGARVSISYDGVEAYTSEVPFVYQENDWKKSKVYFKLSVQEPAGSWSVKLKHNSSKMIIDGAQSQQITTPVPTYAASTGCSSAMSADNFDRAKASIENKSFADEKLTVFKQIIRSNCFLVSQVKEVMGLFSYEEEKLEVAKLAYPKTVDQGNYYQVNDALTYSDSVEELEDFLAQQ